MPRCNLVGTDTNTYALSAVSQGMHIQEDVQTGDVTFYIGYARFPNSVAFHEKNSQLRYPNLVYSYYSVDKQVFHKLLRPANTR